MPKFLASTPFFLLTCAVLAVVFASLASSTSAQQAPNSTRPLELSRPVRPWEFLPSTGTQAALLGNESGEMEAWVYPLKIFRNFHLKFVTLDQELPAETLARTVTVRPESATILYAGDTFTVHETFFTPVHEQGALIVFDVETEQPFDIEASFRRDFQLEWPAALGATYIEWQPQRNAFRFGEEQGKFVAFVGSPTAAQAQTEYQTNYSESNVNSFRLGVIPKGKQTRTIVIAASLNGRAAAEQTYDRLASSYPQLKGGSAKYYADYLQNTVRLKLPDAQLQQAYDWARVSTIQGLITNPSLGTGLVAGYRAAGESQRPGFAWFFGRDSFWTSFALNSIGDFATTRAALDFIAKFQRDDGKIPHEIAQGAPYVNWFQDFPYPYASADATPLYIVAVNDYVTKSGDVAYITANWSHLQKAYDFLRSTYDEQGFPQNHGVGHGWVEGGPLLPVKTELYQAAAGAEAFRALANLARLTNKNALHDELARSFALQQKAINDSFWLPDVKRFAFALDRDNHPVDEATVLSTVPMWFELLDGAHAEAMITQLAGMDHQSDWGMRIISYQAPRYSGGGYHYGSVWPLFTGWASVGEYKYHRALPAYENLRANALLALDGSLGHVTEVLSGDEYQPLSTSSPHQIWSASMVVSPLLRGLLGLEADALTRTLTFAPHVPADWPSFAIENIAVADCRVNAAFERSESGFTVTFERTAGPPTCSVDFQPAISPRARIRSVEANGKPLSVRVEQYSTDQHAAMQILLTEPKTRIQVTLDRDFRFGYTSQLPPLGSTSQGLRVLSETWSPSKDRLELELEGTPGQEYNLSVYGANQIKRVDGGELVRTKIGDSLKVTFPLMPAQNYAKAKVVLQFE